ncbi:M15 family metallopeptidase [Flavobacteriaceae bacterium]|nr:M15 family metallopeptidase [Flavobacteriaceae bacterium]
MRIKIIFLFHVIVVATFAQVPPGFVYVQDLIPSIQVDLRYYSQQNFLGTKVDGYHKNIAILTNEAAQALKNVQNELLQENLSILFYDGYRPQVAVNHFVRWSRDLKDTLQKKQFYPDISKQYLFKEGYISSKSGHSRGSTLDVTIVDLTTGEALDMGSPFDFFGMQSWFNYNSLRDEQKSNRLRLRNIMLKYGFMFYEKEWWHFKLLNEPFPDVYFDFDVN